MTRRAWALAVPLLVLAAPAAQGLALPLGNGNFLVGVEAGELDAVSAALKLIGLRVDRSLASLQVLRVEAPSLTGLKTLAATPGVAWAEKDMDTRSAGSQWNGAQWNGVQWDGAQWNGGAGAAESEWGHEAVLTPEAWKIEKGNWAANVCVVDSGVDPDHPDLAENIWGAAVHGYNAITGSTDASDDAGHGTHVAGVVGAVRGNGIGIAGVSRSDLMSAKVLDSSGNGKVSHLALGMVWCADQGADVMLLALSIDGESRTIGRALDHAQARDVLVVASAGNTGDASGVAYPARDPRVLAVGAVGSDLRLAGFSARGPQVDLAAPGVDVISTFDGGAYASGSGTSQAAAWVAGAAALLREHRPDLPAAAVRSALVNGAHDMGAPGNDDGYGAGLLDVQGALIALQE